jgi:hypothetical protein
VVWDPVSWVFDANSTAFSFGWTVTSINAFISGAANPTAALPSTTSVTIPVSFAPSGAEGSFHARASANLVVQRRTFVWDVNGNTPSADAQAGLISNIGSQDWTNTNRGQHFVVGRRSQVYSITVSTPPTNSVTLTIVHPFLSFTPASLTWNANDVSKTFTFVPTGIPPVDVIQQLEILVTGPDAQYYDYNPLWTVLNTIVVLPALSFSPIPATYIDGSAENLFVSLTDAFASNQFPYPSDRSFSIHIRSPAPAAIYIEPNTLSFSPTNPFTQQFRIVHVYPNGVHSAIAAAGAHTNNPGSDAYALTWSLKWIGTSSMIAITTSIVPQDAQRVTVTRYQIIPEFPRVLSYDWQDAMFNITRAPIAHLSLHPHAPHRDGKAGSQVYGTSAGAAGKVVTDPPVVVFNPGQKVAHFRVKAIPGINQDRALYYRVDWQLSAHPDDRVCYIESGDTSPQNGAPLTGVAAADAYTFSTYHVASAGSLALTVTIFVATALLLIC